MARFHPATVLGQPTKPTNKGRTYATSDTEACALNSSGSGRVVPDAAGASAHRLTEVT